ncbi:unnamed protein product [Rotaria sp. Silwood1]|nr:unnamed protein product [Rotaria sp. Silwood1]
MEGFLIDSDEVSARAIRRYCYSEECLNLQFQEKEQIAIGEEQIQHDLDEQHTYRDITTSAILLEEEPPQSYDITINDSIPLNLGPCLH